MSAPFNCLNSDDRDCFVDDRLKKARDLQHLLNQREQKTLHSLACLSGSAVRRHPEKRAHNEYRQAFSQDADRILNSLAFTRYIDKTQVFSLIQNDHLTHRVLHVQLLSRVARTIGRYLGLNQDLIEAASLGHDIGHPPFGHDGERFLSTLTHAGGAGYFHHNVQSLQFLDKIERKGSGWNLSLQTLDAILCHDGETHIRQLAPREQRTFADLDQMINLFHKEEQAGFPPMTLEGCVVRMADTISYIGRDLEDGIRLGLVKRGQIPDVCRTTLGTTNGTIVFTLVTDLIANSLDRPFVGFSRETSQALEALKDFNYSHIYKNPAIKQHLGSIRTIYEHLFYQYLDDLEKENRSSAIFTRFLSDMSDTYCQTHSPVQMVRDFISGMTDSYFIRQAPAHLRPTPVDHV
ncbi:MAG TPA: HD domain-containing protein [Desulfotignum sp.]|nr:HD domain-containing protein [Desulfotignum sp.]